MIIKEGKEERNKNTPFDHVDIKLYPKPGCIKQPKTDRVLTNLTKL